MEIKERQIRDFAQCAAMEVFRKLIASTNIDRITAMEAVKDAGDAFAAALDLDLREHGVQIVKEVAA
jgi:hypothetical protein